MSEVDDKIVEMKFNNSAFEQRLAETIKSLDKLRQSLDFANSKRGLDDLSRAGNSFNMGNMAATVEGVSAKFLAMSTIAITALANITTKAIQTGAQLVKSLTIAPVLDGFREYETNMNSIQTILANTKADGSTLEDVNSALDKLNHYSDQTIYNFSQMARNIGTFTAAGVDLDKSVNSIKGIANLAAISGSSSEQASTAMYQLSQALAAGKVNLMDWNSVVNAGMGGEVFKKALFETGKAMKTITDVPVGASFEEWEKKGGTFREQMQKGWLTADVLSTTLSAFSGDLNEATLQSLGFSAAAAKQMIELGTMGQAAATEVKTFTQLMSTVKESVASGWSQTFRTVIGDFAEAKTLYTGINNFFSGIIGHSADVRNMILQGWKDMGGRNKLIAGVVDVFKSLGNIIRPISMAFRQIFPAKTATDLYRITEGFANFAEKLRELTGRYLPQIRHIFAGVFAAIEIGIEVIKNVGWLISDIFFMIGGAAGNSALTFLMELASTILSLNDSLVGEAKIQKFFARISYAIRHPMEAIKEFKETIVSFFSSFSGSQAVENTVGRVTNRFGALGDAARKVGDAMSWVADRFRGVAEALSDVWNHIKTWLSELGKNIAEVLKPSDFDSAVDAVNVGLLGGLVILFKKFMDNGFNFNFNFLDEGLIDKITNTFDGLTGALKAMQADLKAKALMKIAIAIGILTASVLVLSMIDSAALTKALVALTVGFGQLVGTMMMLDKITMGTGAAKMTALATGLILIATAVAILSLAIKNLSSLSWEELAKGLGGVAVGIGIMVVALNAISTGSSGMIRAGIGMAAMAAGMYILAQAVQAFATMSWTEMAKGLTGVGVGLGVITVAMKLMPVGSTLAAGAAMIPLAIGLTILSGAVMAFGSMDWEEMGRGLVGIGAALLIIGFAMGKMPLTLPVTAAGLVILSVALNLMSLAVMSMGSMKLDQIAKGVGGLGVMLGVLVIAMNAMQGALAGAAALVVVSGALLILTQVVKTLGNLSFGELALGIGAMAAVLLVLGVAGALMTPVIPTLMGLGVALALIGGAFALFGLGASLVAKAFEIMAKAGVAGIKAFIKSIELFITSIPKFVAALVKGLAESIEEILSAIPLLVKVIREILAHLLDTITELAPKIGQAFVAIISTAISAVRELFPDLLAMGAEILLTLLRGIRDNIYELTTIGVEIMVNLGAALVANMATIVEAGVSTLLAFLGAIAARAADIVTAGVNLIVSFLLGITQEVDKITAAATFVIVTFLLEIANSILKIVEAGLSILVGLLKGISDNINKVVEGVTQIVITFLQTLVDSYLDIVEAGAELLVQLLKGISDNVSTVITAVTEIVTEFVDGMMDNWGTLAKAGADALVEFLRGISDNLLTVSLGAMNVALEFIDGLADQSLAFARAAADVLVDFLNGLADAIRDKAKDLRDAGKNIAGAILEGLTFGLSGHFGTIANLAKGAGEAAVNGVKKGAGVESPSWKAFAVGEFVMIGFAQGISRTKVGEKSAEAKAEAILGAFSKTIKRGSFAIPEIGDMSSPVITPVLDLDQIRREARGLDAMFHILDLQAGVSVQRAEILSTAELAKAIEDNVATQGVTEVNFEQNIYAPEAPSVNDIYRNTKSQLVMAKEELGISS